MKLSKRVFSVGAIIMSVFTLMSDVSAMKRFHKLNMMPLFVWDKDQTSVSRRESRLCNALRSDNVEESLMLLALSGVSIDVNEQDANGETALHVAIQRGLDGIVIDLLSNVNIKVNLKDFEYDTPLHVAARYNRSLYVRALLQRTDVKTKERNRAGDTFWHILARDLLSHTETIRGLMGIPEGVKSFRECMNLKNKNAETPLSLLKKDIRKERMFLSSLSVKELPEFQKIFNNWH